MSEVIQAKKQGKRSAYKGKGGCSSLQTGSCSDWNREKMAVFGESAKFQKAKKEKGSDEDASLNTDQLCLQGGTHFKRPLQSRENEKEKNTKQWPMAKERKEAIESRCPFTGQNTIARTSVEQPELQQNPQDLVFFGFGVHLSTVTMATRLGCSALHEGFIPPNMPLQ